MSNAILFKTCLGFNDARAFGSFKADPRTGATELLDCLNLTTTPDGCLEKVPALETALTHSAPVTAISAGSRFLFQDSINTNEWLGGTTVATRFPVLSGPMVHTPIDCRVSGGAAVYKSTNSAPAVLAQAVLGTNPNPVTSKTFAAMPLFAHAFTFNGLLYAVNAADPRFLQHSEYGLFDVWNLGDGFIGHTVPVLQAGGIIGAPGMPGCLVATHAGGVSVYVGSNTADFIKKFYPCAVADGTLFSGFIDKVNAFGHVFLCDDGVYLVGGDGTLVNLTVDQTDHLNALNTTYRCATVQDGKYLAFGDVCCVEYDFKTKTLLKRDHLGVVGAAVWNGVNYYASGSTVAQMGSALESGTALPACFTLPFSDLGVPGTKSFEALYFTGTMTGGMVISVVDQTGKSWEIEVNDDLVAVSNYRIRVPRGVMGNHVSFTVTSPSGAFRIEELRAVLAGSKRSR